MILTGSQIHLEVAAGRIHIDDFDPARLEPNSYGFRLAPGIIRHGQDIFDCFQPAQGVLEEIGPGGYVLQPGKFYLGATMEAMGSHHYAAELYASRSTATAGIWIQFSAPLGHCGAIFPWTLEIQVACPVRVYPGMTIGKLAFWSMQGKPKRYQGRYTGSRSVVRSRLSLDAPWRPPAHTVAPVGMVP